jgi:hypothetical protein
MKKIILTLCAIVLTAVMVQAQNADESTAAKTVTKKVEQTTYSGSDSDVNATQTPTNKKEMGEETKKAMIEVEKQKADYKKQAKAKVKKKAEVDN